MSWSKIAHGKALDLDTLSIGGKVRATTWSNALPIITLEKLAREVDADTMGPVTIVSAGGRTLESPAVYSRLGWLRRDLASHYFLVNGTSDPVPRILGSGLNFYVSQNKLGAWSPFRIKTVEIWS